MGIIFSYIIGLLMSFEAITDNDWFWHYVVGNWVVKNKTIPTTELFSWFGNFKWTAHEWLTEVIMYKLTPIGCIITMLIIFLLLYILMTKMLKLKLNKLFDFKLLYLLMMCVFFKVTGPRPYIISLLFFAYLVYVLFTYLDKSKKKEDYKLIYTIPILQILWVNLHGGSSSLAYIFIIGVLLCNLVLHFIPLKSNRIIDLKLSKKQIKTLLIILVLTILASCINPWGYKMLLYPFTNMADSNMTNYILEWNSPSFHNMFGLYIFILVAFPIINLCLTEKKLEIYEVAFQLLMLYMCLKSQRFIGMYGIYSTWTVGKYFFVNDNMYELLKKPFQKFSKIITCLFCLFLILGASLVAYKQVSSYNNSGIIDNDGFYSDEAIEYLIDVKPQRLYNDYSQGGYLLYKLNEKNALDNQKIFAYGLGDVFSKDILPDTVELQDLQSDPKLILDKYNFDYLITTKAHTLRYYLEESPNYENVYQDDMCFIYHKIN